jgi:hypothetical protein
MTIASLSKRKPRAKPISGKMLVTKKPKIAKQVTGNIVRVKKYQASKTELEQATKKAIKQYHQALKNLARR